MVGVAACSSIMASQIASPRGWNVIVCGRLSKPVLLYVSEPDNFTVVQLKEMIETETGIPTSEQVLYCKEKELDSDKEAIAKYEGMRNGIAIYVTRLDRFIINVQNSDNGVEMKFQLPLDEANEWLIAALRKQICYKFGIDMHAHHMLAVEGVLLSDTSKNRYKTSNRPSTIGDYEMIQSGCTITLTLLSVVEFCRPHPTCSENSAIVPLNTSYKFANEKIFDNRLHFQKTVNASTTESENISVCKHVWQVGWTIYIKQLDGTKIPIKLSNDCPRNISVFRFREMISKEILVPTFQQRLVCGDNTIMNDWKSSSPDLLRLSDYQFYDGITVSLVVLTNGIQLWIPKNCFSKSTITDYINIPCPDQMTIKQLEEITTKVYSGRKELLFHVKGCCYASGSYTSRSKHVEIGSKCEPDEVVSSLTWLPDNDYHLKCQSS